MGTLDRVGWLFRKKLRKNISRSEFDHMFFAFTCVFSNIVRYNILTTMVKEFNR